MPVLSEESPVRYVNEWGSRPPEMLIAQSLDELAEQPHQDEKPVLVLDQFEDVFKTPRDRDRLWDRLAEAVNLTDTPSHVLISMREEWLGAWQESEDYLPDALASLIRLRPLSDAEVLRAILEPVQREGTLTMDPGLARMLVADLRKPSAFGTVGYHVEPGLLQLVCRRLWALADMRKLQTIPQSLYEELGGADRIIREFVWNELGSAGMDTKEIPDPERPGPVFSAFDRILWAGLTRHLIAAHGVKSTVSVDQLARTLLTGDLGIAGPAIAEKELTDAGSAYLAQAPEKRGTPPRDLAKWIYGVLSKAVEVGFMKRQLRLLGPRAETSDTQVAAAVPDEGDRHIYELSHDALADILQSFKIEFEGWIRMKIAKLVGGVVGAIIALPLLYMLASVTLADVLGFLGMVLLMIVGGGAYIVSLLIMTYIAKWLGRLFLHPIYRRLVHGRVPLRLMR
jgi:hypothetical protein